MFDSWLAEKLSDRLRHHQPQGKFEGLLKIVLRKPNNIC
ncbi:hypothetical protein CWATWH8502_4427 [Crocosphaera watsonii WH 8502]|uniref:Uncharacterized protein n=1 Tax=Crocosphaera watsonii WH 8502 TaxID=423474 RepID=T2IMX5_CROWT|nr:hypothetical protein CWATWH8502_4427 [Crocosphaera watsonii WH 8502]